MGVVFVTYFCCMLYIVDSIFRKDMLHVLMYDTMKYLQHAKKPTDSEFS